MAFWTTEARFTTNESPPTVTLVSAAHSGSVRARFSACPEDVEGCRPGEPFTLQLPSSGQRTFQFPDFARPVTLDVQRAPWHPFYLIFLALLFTSLGLVIRGREERLLLASVVFTGGLYFSQTLGQTRGLDVSGHLAHVQKIATDGPFVNAQACWECFHPPLYYWVASALLGFPAMLRPWAATVLQGLSLLLHCLSVPLVVAALRPFARSRRELLLYAGLVLLWPAGVLASVRLGNDSALNFCAFGVMLLLLRSRLVGAAALAAVALLVKESAVTLVGLVALFGAFSPFRPRARGIAGLLLGLGVAASWGVSRLKQFDPRRMEALSPDLHVVNTLRNVALPDPLAFLREPFVSPWVTSPNRDHLLNYFWKTALFGEWPYAFPFAAFFASLLSAALVALLAAAGVAWWRGGRPLFPALLLAISLAAVMGYRLIHPFATNADFRFVYPLTALGLALALARGKLRWGRRAAAAFLLVSQLIFVLHWCFEA